MTATVPGRLRVRTAFISDVHLGYRGCQAEYVLDFLRHVDCDTLVLVGDIVDLWSLKRVTYWPDSHQQVLRQFVQLSRSGVRVVYVPGNHDEALREFCGLALGAIEVAPRYEHVTADGRRLLVLHGDEFDGNVQFSAALKHVGDVLYGHILLIGRALQRLRRRLGRPYWSLATWIKQRVPDARKYIERFEQAALAEARRRGFDGVVCGHIHRPELREVDGVLYCNDGDWVEHCTALVEDRNGRLALVRWAERAERPQPVAPVAGVALDPAA
jgi:UDP-2,3-diacylglucosamine pyrophosphatase LpxH